MTAVLPNNQNGPFGFNIDGFTYPQFITAYRAPTANDIYNPGTRWFNSVTTTIYETTGYGEWVSSTSGGTFSTITVSGLSTLAATNITGTANINTSGSAVTTIGTGGTGAVNIGNTTGNTAVTGSLTASTSLTATAGNITATNGNVVINGAGKMLQVKGGAVTNFIGTGVLTAGTQTIANTNIAAGDVILITRTAVNASTALGGLSYTISAGASFTVTSLQLASPGVTETADVSSYAYLIVRPI